MFAMLMLCLLRACSFLSAQFYNKAILPGYAAIFRHPNDELNCTSSHTHLDNACFCVWCT